MPLPQVNFIAVYVSFICFITVSVHASFRDIPKVLRVKSADEASSSTHDYDDWLPTRNAFHSIRADVEDRNRLFARTMNYETPSQMRASMSGNQYTATLSSFAIDKGRLRFLDSARQLATITDDYSRISRTSGPLTREDQLKKEDLVQAAAIGMRHERENIQNIQELKDLHKEKVGMLYRKHRNQEAEAYRAAGLNYFKVTNSPFAVHY